MKIVETLPTSLAIRLSAADTQFTVKQWVDIKENAVTISAYGANAPFVVISIKDGINIENIICSTITQNTNGTATFTIATNGRNLDASFPYTGYSTGYDFDVSATVISSNDPFSMDTFANTEETNTFSQIQTFTVPPQITADPVNNNDAARKSWILTLVLGTLTTINEIIPGTAGATIAAGNTIYFDTGTDTWKLASASTSATCQSVILAIAQGTGTNGNPITNGVLLQGLDANQSILTPGVSYYIQNTAGTIGTTPGTISVAVGVAKDATHLMFVPNFNVQLTKQQFDALAGTSGTAPSSTNKFVDAADTDYFNPPGTILPYAGISSPTGFLLCDGSTVSRATYSRLFAVLNPTLGTVTITIASPGVITLTAHGLATGDGIYLTTTGSLPTGLSPNTKYWVIKNDANSFWLATSLANALASTKINTSISQSGTHTAKQTPYGVGDGSTTFTLPNLKGIIPTGKDQSQAEFAGLGQTGGEKTHTLITAEIPSHNHSIVTTAAGSPNNSSGAINNGSGSISTMNTNSTGGDGAHNNLQPYITLNYIIKI